MPLPSESPSTARESPRSDDATRRAPAESGLAARVAAFTGSIVFDALPELVVRRAKLAITDTVGAALAGAEGDPGRMIVEYARRKGGGADATFLAAQVRGASVWAAFANGTLAHALDYDDTNYGANGHLSSVLVPVVLALGEEMSAGGRAVIESYVAGFEVGSRLGRDMNPLHYESGWHSTSTIGHIAAAVAASRLLELSPQATRMALGIAATEAGGLRANIGSMTNPLHSGLAAKNGVVAAELASLGWTAAEDGLGARFGFGDMFASGVPIGHAFDDAGRSWDMERVWVAQKLYPSCAATHRAIDALLALRKEHGISAADVERIDCGVDYMVPTYMVYPEPLTPEQARFSMEYTLAVAMTDGRVGLEQYLASRLKDTEVRDLARRVRMYVHPDEDGPESWETRFADLEIRLRGGGTLRSRIYQQRGHPDNPLSAAELDGKYRDAAGRVLAPDAVEASLASLGDLDRLDSIGPLMLVLGGFTDAR